MLTITGNTKTLCRESIECYYKSDGTCTFLEKAGELLIDHYEQCYKGFNSVANVADTYEFPCKIIDEDDRQRGIGNLFGN